MQIFREDGTFLCNAVLADGIKRNIGLMFRRRLKKDEGLLLRLSSAYIHSFFVFFNFHAIFLDKDFKVVEEFIMKPFRITKVDAEWVLELMPGKNVKTGEKLIIR